MMPSVTPEPDPMEQPEQVPCDSKIPTDVIESSEEAKNGSHRMTTRQTPLLRSSFTNKQKFISKSFPPTSETSKERCSLLTNKQKFISKSFPPTPETPKEQMIKRRRLRTPSPIVAYSTSPETSPEVVRKTKPDAFTKAIQPLEKKIIDEEEKTKTNDPKLSPSIVLENIDSPVNEYDTETKIFIDATKFPETPNLSSPLKNVPSVYCGESFVPMLTKQNPLVGIVPVSPKEPATAKFIWHKTADQLKIATEVKKAELTEDNAIGIPISLKEPARKLLQQPGTAEQLKIATEAKIAKIPVPESSEDKANGIPSSLKEPALPKLVQQPGTAEQLKIATETKEGIVERVIGILSRLTEPALPKIVQKPGTAEQLKITTETNNSGEIEEKVIGILSRLTEPALPNIVTAQPPGTAEQLKISAETKQSTSCAKKTESNAENQEIIATTSKSSAIIPSVQNPESSEDNATPVNAMRKIFKTPRSSKGKWLYRAVVGESVFTPKEINPNNEVPKARANTPTKRWQPPNKSGKNIALSTNDDDDLIVGEQVPEKMFEEDFDYQYQLKLILSASPDFDLWKNEELDHLLKQCELHICSFNTETPPLIELLGHNKVIEDTEQQPHSVFTDIFEEPSAIEELFLVPQDLEEICDLVKM